MALIGNNADTLLHGLSAFWHRFFRDIKDIAATYEGTEILLGQVYLNFLSDVLNTSVVEAPIFRKEFYKLITVREDQLVFHEHGDILAHLVVPRFYGNPGTDRYVLTSSTFYEDIPQLQDTLFSPKAALKSGTDYRVTGGELAFQVDPTNPVLPGFAQRRVVVGIGGKFTASSVASWVAAGVQKGDTLYFSETIDLGNGSPLNAQDTARVAKIVHVTPTHLSVSIDTPLPTFPVGVAPTGFSWRVMRIRDDGTYSPALPLALAATTPFTDGQLVYTPTLEVNEVSFWAVDARVDDLTIYKTYGYFFTDANLSTETYRSLIRGLMQLYIMGPALARLESALNLTAGLPTIREQGEILAGYDNGILDSGTTGTLLAGGIFQTPSALFSPLSIGGFVKISSSNFANNIGEFNVVEYISTTQVRLSSYTPFTADTLLTWRYSVSNKQVVTTDRNIYEFALEIPMRLDVATPANFGVLTFQAFESLTTAIQVTDYVQDPEWWHTITIPQEFLPDKPVAYRVSTPSLYPNIIGPLGDASIGDPGFYIGRDEDNMPAVNPYRHKASFILMDRFLKLHMFAVLVDQSISLTTLLIADLQKILKDVKPVHTALYFRPQSTFTDYVDLTDLVTVKAVRKELNEMAIVNNELLIGSTWVIGNTWKYLNAVGGVLDINPGIGGMFATIGGVDPLIQPADPTNIPPGTNPDVRWIDRPLYVYMHV